MRLLPVTTTFVCRGSTDISSSPQPAGTWLTAAIISPPDQRPPCRESSPIATQFPCSRTARWPVNPQNWRRDQANPANALPGHWRSSIGEAGFARIDTELELLAAERIESRSEHDPQNATKTKPISTRFSLRERDQAPTIRNSQQILQLNLPTAPTIRPIRDQENAAKNPSKTSPIWAPALPGIQRSRASEPESAPNWRDKPVVLAELGRARAALREAECGCVWVCVRLSVSLCCWPAASTLHPCLLWIPESRRWPMGARRVADVRRLGEAG